MVFNSLVVVIILLVWVVGLTAWAVYRELQFRRFFGKTKSGVDIRRLLEELLQNVSQNEETVKKIGEILGQIEKKDVRHIQKIGLVRFNPFRDAGGNQSFALALLNEEYSGIVLTGLHARDTTRLYVKDVVKGTGRSELSSEEKQAIGRAITGK